MIEVVGPITRLVRTDRGFYIGPFWAVHTMVLTTDFPKEMNELAMRFLITKHGFPPVDFTNVVKLPTVDPAYRQYEVTLLGIDTILGKGMVFHGTN